MTSIKDALVSIKSTLPENVTLIAVSKYHPKEDLMEAYDAGQRDFGENIVQELRLKQEQLPNDINWHFIGHLQTNKVKYIAPYVSLIHSVDSLKLLYEINRQAQKNQRVIDCLLQIHVAQETTKFGFFPEECYEMLSKNNLEQFKNVRICGIMCMASNTIDTQQIHQDFKTANNFFEKVKTDFFSGKSYFSIKSYGMSGDYSIAIEENSNMVRIGTRIFGPRKY